MSWLKEAIQAAKSAGTSAKDASKAQESRTGESEKEEYLKKITPILTEIYESLIPEVISPLNEAGLTVSPFTIGKIQCDIKVMPLYESPGYRSEYKSETIERATGEFSIKGLGLGGYQDVRVSFESNYSDLVWVNIQWNGMYENEMYVSKRNKTLKNNRNVRMKRRDLMKYIQDVLYELSVKHFAQSKS